MVESIECIGPELQSDPLLDAEVLQSRQIDVVEVRSPCVVTSSVADGIQARIGELLTKRLSRIEDHTVRTTCEADSMRVELR